MNTKNPQLPAPPEQSETAPDLVPDVSTEEGMRFYAAILGHEPTLDPAAPDLLPSMGREGETQRTWTDDLAILRDDISRKLQKTLKRRPNWREIMDAMTVAAHRRIEEARKRLNKRDAA